MNKTFYQVSKQIFWEFIQIYKLESHVDNSTMSYYTDSNGNMRAYSTNTNIFSSLYSETDNCYFIDDCNFQTTLMFNELFNTKQNLRKRK